MSADVLAFPSGGAVDCREEIVGRDFARGKLAQLRHVSRTRTPAAGFPVVPDLTHGTDAERCGIKRQVVPLPPGTKRVLGSLGNHRSTCKLFAYRLTSESKRFSGSIVSAEILQFGRMEDAPNRIREIRVTRGLSQQALGDLIGTSKMTVSDLERGRMELTLEYMRRLGAALQCVPIDLLPNSDNPDRLTAEERRLLQNYREAPETQKAIIERVALPIEDEASRRSAA